MEFVMSFWMPILCSAVAVFIASWATWMLLPHHRTDYKRLEGEDGVMAAIRGAISGPGQYAFPYVDPKDMKNKETIAKFEEGASGSVLVFAGNPMNMGKSLLLHFLHMLVIALLVCYFCYRTFGFGAQYLEILRVGGFIAVLAYIGPLASQAIWHGRPWGVVFKEMADGVFYALLMASVLGLLWPFSA